MSTSLVRVVGTEFDLGADMLPPGGVDRVQVWAVVAAWSPRRALLLDGTPFLRAFWDWDGTTSTDRQDMLLTNTVGCVRGSLRSYVDMLVGRRFLARVMLPDFVPGPGERVEVSDVRVALRPPSGWMAG